MDKTPVALGASAIYHLHNHPSGDPTPSPEGRALHLGIRIEGACPRPRAHRSYLDAVFVGERAFRSMVAEPGESYRAEPEKKREFARRG